MKVPVAIDTDPGIDDALALMLAMRSPEVEVELLTTVAGNVPVKVGTRNAKRLVALVNPENQPIIAEGAAAPLARRLTTATHVHGGDGLGGNAGKYPIPRAMRAYTEGHQHLVEFSRRHGERGVIVALGPLTNLARAIRDAPKVMATLGRLVIMGGAVRVPGNVSAVAEFNIYVDPEAADLVFTSGLDMLLIPLDVTRQVVLSVSRVAALGRARLPAAVKRFTLAGAKRHGGLFMHDPLAVASAIDPSLVGTERLVVRVETEGSRTRGMTVVDLRSAASVSGPGVAVATSVSAKRMLSLLEQRVLSPRRS